MIEYYLSPRHANSPGMGCVISALGSELARKLLPVRKRIEVSREAYRERLLPFVPGSDARIKSGEVSAVVPQYGWRTDCGPDDLVPPKARTDVDGGEELFIKYFVEE
jgi:TetR/AcrR family transcriptional repressor of nem operon